MNLVRLCVLLATCVSAKNHVDNLASRMVQIKLNLNEAELSKLIAECLFGNDEALRRHFRLSDVSLSDFIQILQPQNHQITLEDALKELQLQFDDVSERLSSSKFNWKIFNEITSDVDVAQVYHLLRYRFLKNPTENTRRILKILEIDQEAFDKAGSFKGGKEMLEVLSTGRYSKRNVEMVLDVLGGNISLLDFLQLLKTVNLEQIVIKLKNTAPPQNLFDTLRYRLITPRSAVHLMELFNLTATDFYANQAFAALLKHVTDFNEEVVGVPISPNKILTFIYADFLKNHTLIVAETFGNPSTQYKIQDITYDRPNVAQLETAETLRMEFVELPDKFDRKVLQTCYYISKTDDNLLFSEDFVPEFDENQVLSIVKTPKTVFNLGSPLICGNLLYGVANWEHQTRIEFAPIYL